MTTLQEFGTAVIQIREALEELSVKGSQNAAIVLFCNKKCNEIIGAINEAEKTANPGNVDVRLEITDEDAVGKEDDLNGEYSRTASID